MQGVSSALIARNESWVRQQASILVRRLPSNVEKADLIQVGLIAVAQAAVAFRWNGDGDSDEAREAFVRFAKQRVKGAMIDELRQMDQLERSQRRKIKAIQIARERWHALHGKEPRLSELSAVCGIGIDEIASLEQAAALVQAESLSDHEGDDAHVAPRPATPQDEVEARVDTAIVLRRLERFFATLPERERQVIDAYLGVGMTPVELAAALKVTPSRVSQFYAQARQRIARHFQHDDPHRDQRAVDHAGAASPPLHELVALREAALARSTSDGPWGELLERALTTAAGVQDDPDDEERLIIDEHTRWG